jgi:hypothetical protein
MPLDKPSSRDNFNGDQTSTVHIYTGGNFQTVSYAKKRDSPKRAVDVKT